LAQAQKDVLLLLTKDLIDLVLLANLIAWPLGWLLMNNWLNDFAYSDPDRLAGIYCCRISRFCHCHGYHQCPSYKSRADESH